jgi:AraC family transcriptional regulator
LRTKATPLQRSSQVEAPTRYHEISPGPDCEKMREMQMIPDRSIAAPPVAPTRTALLQSNVALVEDLRSPGVQVRTAEDFSSDFQVCLPYRGVFRWHVGDEDVVGDANQILFVRGGEPFRISQPMRGKYAEIIITPNRTLLGDLAGGRTALALHPLFRKRSRRAPPQLQLRLARLLYRAKRRTIGGLAGDEAVIDLLRCALESNDSPVASTRASRRLTGQAKEFLGAHLTESIRLGQIARAVGVSPAYLTDLFRRVEGVSLHRYLTQLRLARALAEIPHTNDLTALALGLGFSSHSHFTAAFRRAFGCTPSRFRESARFG